MYLNNTYERISALISIMAANYVQNHGYTVSDIAKKLDLPIKVVCNDIAVMMETYPFSGMIFIGSDEADEHSSYDMRDGKCDEETISIDPQALTEKTDVFLVPFTRIENLAVRNWFGGNSPAFSIKHTGEVATDSLIKKLDRIYMAIESSAVIEYVYTNNSGKTERWCKCVPKEIRINSRNPQNAKLISSNGTIFSIKKMENIRLLKNSDYHDPDRAFNDDWNAIWDLPSQAGSREAQTWHVTLLVKNNTRNILAKMRADTQRRVNKKWTELENGDYIYEDEVSGFHGFKKWVMGYGSNLKVMEPAWLADEICGEFEIVRKQYETGKFI